MRRIKKGVKGLLVLLTLLATLGMNVFAEQQLEAGFVVSETGEEDGISTYASEEEVVVTSEPDAGMIADAVQSAAEESGQEITAYSQDLVVVLCAGHDDAHRGYMGSGLLEHELTFKVAKYCKEELEKYAGVVVYTDRETLKCAYDNVRVADCENQRVKDAAQKGADLLVDLHFNVGGESGAEVYYPNTSYNWEIHEKGEPIANQILVKLEELGLTNRGAKTRDRVNGEKDENGVTEDYYRSIVASKKAGFLGVAVEHAYLDNTGDAERLVQEEFLQALGVADAQGIARAYGLLTNEEAKMPVVEAVNITNKDEFQGGFRVEVKIASGIVNLESIEIPVWTEKDGPDDIRTYTAQSAGNGVYYADVKISDHKGEHGVYNIQTYVTPKYNGSKTLADQQTYTVKQNQVSLQVEETSEFLKFQSTVQFDAVPQDLDGVMFAVWSEEGGQDDLAWYTGENTGNNIWTVITDMRKHAPIGTWQIHAYEKQKSNGHMVLLGTGTASKPAINLSDISYDAWYMEYVYEAYINGWMTGYSNGTFGPSDKLTRGQFATILYRMEGAPAQNYVNRFPDVLDGRFYSVAISWGVENGIITGYENGLFGPEDNVTREQLATLFYRLAQKRGLDMSQQADLGRFADADKVSAYAKEAMEWCVAKEIIRGEGDGKMLNPLGNADRAGCATMITRYQKIR